MLFTSITFYAILAIVSCVFYVTPGKWRVWFLLVASYIFYAVSSHLYVLLLLISTAATYWAGIAITKTEVEKHKLYIMSACIAMLVGVLIIFKVNGVLRGLLLPLGISYYSFKQLEWAASEKADFDNIEQGFRLILGGLLMKLLIADRISAFIDVVDGSPQQYKWSVIATVIVCYTLQLYADFSGYTNIALGIGKVFGINGPRNFNAPFAAATIPQMWQRWHMSLTSWVTDYLFTPLNMTMRGLGRTGLLLAIAINMIVIGLWHGLTPNFLMFGVLHAIFTIVTMLTAGWRNKVFPKTAAASKIRLLLGMVLTFALMTFSQIFWHTGTWAAAITHFDLFFGLRQGGELGFESIRTDVVEPLIPCLLIAYYVGLGAPGMARVRQIVDRLVPNWVQYGFFILLISALSLESGTSFVYGQF